MRSRRHLITPPMCLRWLAAAWLVVTAGCSDVGDSSAIPSISDSGVDGTSASDDSAAGSGPAADTSLESSGPAAEEEGGATAESSVSTSSDGSDASGPVTPVTDAATVTEAATVDSTLPQQETGTSDSAADVVADAAVDATGDAREAEAPDSSETSTDSGEPDASQDTAADAPDTGGLVPCTTANQMGCVSCPNQAGGTCTQSDAIFVEIDIKAGLVTATGPDADPNSCLACLDNAGCIDDANQGQVKKECEDFAGSFTAGTGTVATKTSACLGTLECMIGPSGASCAASPGGDTFCYCGTAGDTPSAASCSTNGATVNGPCLAQEAAGFTFAQTDALHIIDNFTDQTGANPGGIANQMLNCAKGNGCTSCLQ